jgi:hypothetical protein
MLVAAFDPGLTTGYALADFAERDDNPIVPFRLISAYPLDSPADVVRKANESWADIIVVEDFVGSGPRTREATHTLKLVGYLQYFNITHFTSKTILHQPQWRKGYVALAEQVLREHPLCQYNKHAADALAHIFAYHARNRAGP